MLHVGILRINVKCQTRLSFNFFVFILLKDCSNSLGMESGEISDEVITASSALRVNYEPWLARLHSQLGEGGWCAGVSKHFYLIHIRKIQMALTVITSLLI